MVTMGTCGGGISMSRYHMAPLHYNRNFSVVHYWGTGCFYGHQFAGSLNTWRPEQNDICRHLQMFFSEKKKIDWIVLWSLFPKGPIDNEVSMESGMAWHQTGDKPLTHSGRDKTAAFFQTTVSNAFSWMKMYEFHLIFQWCLFLMVQITVVQQWFI